MNILTAWTSAQRIIKIYACRDDSANQAANIYKSDYAALLRLDKFWAILAFQQNVTIQK